VVLLKNFANIFAISELRKKVLFTLGVLIVHRLGNHIPVIGIDLHAITALMSQTSQLGGFLAYLDMLSGGNLQKCTLFALGIMPYIQASIMMQMLGMTIPALEQLQKEGEYGRKIINQYTRYLALAVSVMQSIGLITLVERNNLVLDPGWGFRFMFILSLTVGAMVVMWLGEQISLHGLGNGSSMIIFAGIVAQFPNHVTRTLGFWEQGYISWELAVLIGLIFVGIAACIVFLEKGERKIPVQYARRIIGQRVYGGQSTYIPFKINPVGVMPVILAGAMLNIPVFAASMLAAKFPVFKGVADIMLPTGITYNVINFVMIIFFAFFYSALIFDPEKLAEDLKKSGGFIPGIRPGRKTAEFFNYILTRIGLVGAIYLGTLAIAPNILNMVVQQMPFYLSGTGLLIVVGVALEMASQIDSYLIEHRYEGFLSTGKLRR